MLAIDGERALAVEDVVDLQRFMSMASEPPVHRQLGDSRSELGRALTTRGSPMCQDYPSAGPIPRCAWRLLPVSGHRQFEGRVAEPTGQGLGHTQ